MSFNLDFPLLQSWKGTLANWQQKIKLLADSAKIGAALLSVQNSWSPEPILASGTSMVTTNGTVPSGWYVQVPGTGLVLFQAQLEVTPVANSGALFVSLPVAADATNGGTLITTNLLQTIACRVQQTGGNLIESAVVTTQVLGRSDVCVFQRFAGATYTGGVSWQLRYGGLYRTTYEL